MYVLIPVGEFSKLGLCLAEKLPKPLIYMIPWPSIEYIAAVVDSWHFNAVVVNGAD